MPKKKNVNNCRKRRFLPFAKGFKRPNKRMQTAAIGCAKPEPEYESAGFFSDIPRPTSVDDWLAQYSVKGQTYSEFQERCSWLSDVKRKRVEMEFVSNCNTILEKYPQGKIYLLPLGDFSGEHCVDFRDLKTFAETYLGIPVVTLSGVRLVIDGEKVIWISEISENDIAKPKHSSCSSVLHRHILKARFNETNKQTQICVDQILQQLGNAIPSDAICMIGLTMCDLYGNESDLFVAGMARGNLRVAVFSFYRYDPNILFSFENWYEIWRENEMLADERKLLILQRSCKLLVHEIMHLLGIAHCIFYECCMNGSGHLEEDYRQPIHLSPVDLRKLQTLVGFDVVDRYKRLRDFYKHHGMNSEYEWVTKRIEYITKQSCTRDR